MRYLIDTNVISETLRKNPNEGVVEWLQITPSERLYLNVIIIGEIKRGIARLDDEKRKQRLISWLDNDLSLWFRGRIFPIDLEIAEKWGILTARYKIPAIDGLLAATAMTHNLTLVTRNTKDFEVDGLQVLNPFV